ncbi:MAG: 16S rRNA (guanine(527)-N(7))-methyltransferase RsmG [Desulfobacterales bacterium]
MKNKKARHPSDNSGFGPKDMDRLLRGCGIRLQEPQLSLLWQYHNLVRRYNPELNLTRIHRFENMVLKLYADSILPAEYLKLPSPLLDLGTGAGMPGIPLKIVHPDLEIVLAESRGHRAGFLKTAAAELKLKGISIYGHAITPSYEQPITGVITRAVEHMAKTLERIRGCLEENGLAIFMKGPGCEREISETVEREKGRFRLLDDIAYEIPNTPHRRRLVIFEREDTPLRRQREKAMEKHPVKIIESGQNQTFKDLKKLLTGKGAKKQQKALISGKKQVDEAVSTFGRQCLGWISKSGKWPPPEHLPDNAIWYQLEPGLFKVLDSIGTNSPLLLVKTPDIPAWDPQHGLPAGCSVLIPFQDPENVGTVIRSAVAFGADAIILLEEAAWPFHPRAVRASGGAVMHARMLLGPPVRNLPGELPLVALSAEGRPINEFKFPDTFGLLVGMEGPGIPEHLREKAVSVPIRPETESLNASAAAAIALYIWSQQNFT